MAVKILFFGSDQYSKIVLDGLKKDSRFEIIESVSPKERPEIGVLASYGKILSKKELEFPKQGILNLHPSLLPKYRGPSPVQTTILNGDKETGISIIKLDEEVDHGPVLAQIKTPISSEDTAQSLYQKLFTRGTEKLLEILLDYLEGKINPTEQDHSKATFTKKLTREDGKIDWKKGDEFNERFIRAMFPWPGAWTQTNISNKRLKILASHLENGKLILDKVQLEGKNPVTWKQFKEGYPEAILS